MSTTLYWHDYETSGVDPAWDRPLQFAGVRTDPNLNVIGEPVTHYCLPPLDRLPHPQACLVTGLTPQFVMEKGRPEPEFMAAVHRELAKPGTCGVGYNSMRFDDEVTRFALYRNFYDPYEREWKNGNSRWDIIDMLRLTRALRPAGIEWPDHEDGAPSFRLEDLTAANGLEHGAAHDALSDVYATIAVAKLVKTRQPKLYDYVYGHRSKQQVGSLINVAERKPFLHVSSRLPRDNAYLAIMMPLCPHPTNSNAIVAVNLMADPDVLLRLDSDTLRERLFTPTAELPAGTERVALKGIHLNRCPVVATTKLLDKPAAQRLGIDLGRCEANYRRLLSHDLREKVQAVFANAEYDEARDAESALYEGFLPDTDRPLLARVRAQGPDKLAGSDIEFHDERYRELLFRYRARYAPETLSSIERDRWSDLRHSWLQGEAPSLLNIGAYNKELDELATVPDRDDRDKAVLQALREWGTYLINKS
jgi:exodeoxyribonuclease-1